MPSKQQDYYYDIASKHRGLNSAKDVDNLTEGEYSWNINMLVRNGELVPLRGETYLNYTFASQPLKMITYQTDRNASGALSTTQWLVWNDSAGKIYRGVLTSTLSSVTEILNPEGNSFNIVVEQFIVIHQDLLFHQGHSGEAYLYGYREVIRHAAFNSTSGWIIDRVAAENPTYLPYNSLQSAQAVSEGANDYLYSMVGAVLRKQVLNADGSLGETRWAYDLNGRWQNVFQGGMTPNTRLKIIGVNTTAQEVMVIYQAYELATYNAGGIMAYPYNHNTMSRIWVHDSTNGKFKRQIDLTSAFTNSAGFNDATLRYDSVTDTWRIYLVGSKYTGTTLTSNYLMCVNPTSGNVDVETAFTFTGATYSGSPAIAIDVAFSETLGVMMALIAGWNDFAANDPSVVEVWTHAGGDPPTWTYRNQNVEATPTTWWTNGGIRTVLDDVYATSNLFCLFRRDQAATPTRDMATFSISEDGAYTMTGLSLTTVTFHQYFSCAGDAIQYDGNTSAEFIVGKVSLDGAIDAAWINSAAAVQETLAQYVQLQLTATGSATGIFRKFRYRYAFIYDKEYSALSPDHVELSTQYDGIKVSVYANRGLNWDRITSIAVFRAEYDEDVNSYLEYALLATVPLNGDVKKITINNVEWDFYSTAGSNYAVVHILDGLELLVDSFESLSGFPEDISNLRVRYKSAIYANNRLYVGNVWINNEVLNDRLSWSSLNGLAIPPSNYITLTKGDPDQITALMFHEDWLLVGKQNALFIYDVTSFEPSEWFEVRLLTGVGVIGNNAIAATPHGVFFYGNHSVYRIDRSQGVKDLSTGILGATHLSSLLASKVFYDTYNKTVVFNTSTYSLMYDLITETWLSFYSITSGGDYIYQSLISVDATDGKVYMCGYDSGSETYKLYELFSSTSNMFDIQFAPFGKKNTLLRFRNMWIDSEDTTTNADVDLQIVYRLANKTYTTQTPTTADHVFMGYEGETAKVRIYTSEAKTTITPIKIRGLEFRFIPTRKRRKNII